MELSSNSKSSHLNKITYVNLRWIGVIGQFITINVVAFLLKFEFNFFFVFFYNLKFLVFDSADLTNNTQNQFISVWILPIS